jgi:hypothetical protein
MFLQRRLIVLRHLIKFCFMVGTSGLAEQGGKLCLSTARSWLYLNILQLPQCVYGVKPYSKFESPVNTGGKVFAGRWPPGQDVVLSGRAKFKSALAQLRARPNHFPRYFDGLQIRSSRSASRSFRTTCRFRRLPAFAMI